MTAGRPMAADSSRPASVAAVARVRMPHPIVWQSLDGTNPAAVDYSAYIAALGRR